MLKKLFSISALFFCFSLSLWGQKEPFKEVSLTTSIPKISFGTIKIKDPYLSPNIYTGWHLQAQKENNQFIGKLRNYTFFSNYSFAGGTALHPTKNNLMFYFDSQIELGGKYHFVPLKKVYFAFGTGYEVGLGERYLARNVNNPISIDFYTGLNGIVNIDYRFRFWKTNYRINYGLQTPFAGIMFIPQQGATYYEIFSLQNRKQILHFYAPHNRQAINHYLDFDIRFNKMTIKIGVSQDYRIYRANNMVFRYNALNFNIGTAFNIYRYFGNKQNQKVKFVAPDNFWNNQKLKMKPL